ncbi:hypothetical protein C5167_013450 [Papaver somniferum]|uniref:Uncharacterized protein n=1 Tax=Papaver somniferum TaxID=3469 RepID=A0A4Y7J4F0_PAPSO|nr:legumin B-like [Papaver somniferum]RZC54609.1 hypothetical protein C5167_013450 [Papaver somniferum]
MAEPASAYTGPKGRYIYLPDRKVRTTLDCIYLGKRRKERLRKEYQEKVEAIKQKFLKQGINVVVEESEEEDEEKSDEVEEEVELKKHTRGEESDEEVELKKHTRGEESDEDVELKKKKKKKKKINNSD